MRLLALDLDLMLELVKAFGSRWSGMNVFFMREGHEFGGPGLERYGLNICVPTKFIY